MGLRGAAASPRPRVATSSLACQRCCFCHFPAVSYEKISASVGIASFLHLFSFTCFAIKSDIVELSGSSSSEEGVTSPTNKHKAEVLKLQGCINVQRTRASCVNK